MAPPGNQAVNGESKLQPDISGETGLLDSIYRQSARESLSEEPRIEHDENRPGDEIVQPGQDLDTRQGMMSSMR